jgi:hypothetical protein
LALLFWQHFALIDPNLDTDGSVNSLCGCGSVVNIGAERVERDFAHLVHFASGDFRSVQSSCNHDLHAPAVHAKGSGHCLSHGAAVRNTLFELNGDVFRNELSIKLWLANFRNVDLNDERVVNLSNHVVQVLSQVINSLSASADDGSWSGSENRELNAVSGSLDFCSADDSDAVSRTDFFSEFVVRSEHLRVGFLVSVPGAIRGADNPDSKTDWMYFLTH